METVALIGFVVLLVAVPVLLINRGVTVGRGRSRSRRGASELPFLFFPTTGPTRKPPPVPAWRSRWGDPVELQRPLRAEPGVADHASKPEPARGEPARGKDPRAPRDRSAPL